MIKNKSLLSLSKQSLMRRRRQTRLLASFTPYLAEPVRGSDIADDSHLSQELENLDITEDENALSDFERNANAGFFMDFDLAEDENAVSDFENDAEADIMKPTRFLQQWYCKNNITQTAFSELLVFLKKTVWPNFSADSSTFLMTPKRTTILSVPPGTYVHIGKKKA